jgi:hypothetical protein
VESRGKAIHLSHTGEHLAWVANLSHIPGGQRLFLDGEPGMTAGSQLEHLRLSASGESYAFFVIQRFGARLINCEPAAAFDSTHWVCSSIVSDGNEYRAFAIRDGKLLSVRVALPN